MNVRGLRSKVERGRHTMFMYAVHTKHVSQYK